MNSTVSGTGTDPKVFSSSLSIPGSNRYDGHSLTVRASGYAYQKGTSGKLAISLMSRDPRYGTSGISASSVDTNVATFIAPNNFAPGQVISINGCHNGEVIDSSPSPLNVSGVTVASAQSDQFTVAITTGDLVAAVENATAVLDPIEICASTARTISAGTYASWQIEAEFVLDSHSATADGSFHALVNNLLDTEAPVTTPPTVDTNQEPVMELFVAATFDVSDEDNSATMHAFEIAE